MQDSLNATFPARLAPAPTLSSQKTRIFWPFAIPIFSMHLLACAAAIPWLFSWTGLIACLVGVHVFGQSINLCYHRMLSHRSFRVPRWLERLFVYTALCCMQGTPAQWVATHRLHHGHSDEPLDPHTPLVSLFWSHVGWLLVHDSKTNNFAVYQKYAKDLLLDPFYMRLEKKPWLLFVAYLIHAALYFLIGLAVGWAYFGGPLAGLQFGLSLLVWGVIVRTVLVWHITWSVNSLTHYFGYRNYNTPEQSRNNWLVSLLSVGEGWHNNHHSDPVSASVQHKWWEIDISYYQIKLLELLGLATDVRPPRHLRQKQHDLTQP